MTPESEEALLANLNDEYSDTYKDIYGIRPRWIHFTKVEDAEIALKKLDDDWAAQQESEKYYNELDDVERKLSQQVQSNKPGDLDREHLPKYSGMGHRMEAVNRTKLKRLVEKYRIDLPPVVVPTDVVMSLRSAHAHLISARRAILEAERKSPYDDLGDQINIIHEEFVRKNISVLGGLVDLIEMESQLTSRGLAESRIRKMVRKTIKN